MNGKHQWLMRGCALSVFLGFTLLCIVSAFGVVAIVQTVAN